MSSDAYSNDDIDDETFEQLNAIEAQYQQSTEQRPVSARAPSPINIDSSDYGEFIDLDESALDALKAIEDGTFQQLPRKAAPSLARTSSKGTLQTTLFGEVIPAGSSTTRPKPHALRTRSKQEPRKTKRWDHTAFAKTGVKTGNARGKGKKKQQDEDEEGEEEEEFEFEQFPPPFVSPLKFFQPPPRKIQLDLLEAKHWIFPLNRPKRDYQFDIVRNSLFENTIVALPTGTGKTFIAGVVMLNYYRWFPEGKVVFVAPTRPLVSQQIEACHEACGIPGSDAIEMTGQVSKPIRHKFWGQKRVFYMTPQTLINDLQSENCDARDIVLLVVDEAHRATGDYAYNQVIRYMMAKNPHFRVLALTATPGGNKEAVQTLIDGLHISHIEIRAERELARYNHVKEIEQHVISMTPEINRIKNLFLKLMDSFFKPIAHIWRGSPNLMRMHPFAATSLAASLAQGQRHLCGPLYTLSSFARWLGYLMEGTVKMCYDDLEAYAPKATKAKKVHTNPLFLSLMNEIRAQNAQGFKMHPKMEKMKNLIMQHFGARMSEDGDPESGEGATKAMVFVTHRAAVDEIVEVLNAEQPLIRATPFIGQGTDKKGKKGLAQREQLEIIKKFKNNEFNILVATSIGEEGLDIGEVDLAICYDTQKTPIRLLQRLGRTGRKRSGHVHVLLADGREEANFDKAQSSYEDVQTSIIYGSHLEFYADVERLLPDNVQPQCLEKEMEIIPYVRDEAPKKRDNSPKKGVKRKRNDDIGRNIPQGASTGFVSVADLLVKEKGGKKAKKIREPKNFEALGEDDEDDLELASGIFGAPPTLKKSKSASAPRPKAGTSMLRKSKTLDPNKPKRSKKGKGKEKQKEEAPPPPSEWTASQLQAKGVDDSDDLEIENGVPTTKTKTLSPRRSSSEQAVVDAEVIDLTDSNREASGKLPWFQYPRRCGSADFPLKDFEQAFQSPTGSWSQSPPRVSPSRNDQNIAWLLEDEDEDFMQYGSSPPPPSQVRNGGWFSTRQEAIKHSNTATKAPPTQSKIFRDDMLPPGLPNSPVGSSSISVDASPQAPESSFAVRPVGKKRITTLAFTSSSPSIESPVQTHRRLHRRPESSGSEMPPPTIPGIKRSQDKHKRRKRPRVPMKYNPLYDYEATHSGDEESEGSSGSEDVESESDRMFLKELPETQASPSYDQSLAYRQSLLTQAPDGGPSFASKPVRKGRFGRNSIRTQNSNRRRPGVSSSPIMEDETDLYEFGSFVVSDDAEISYEM
ncbi:P-loop containing nucleoside triphosphate hydrolase protein [Lentinula aff. lateritia]|uniref:P-loop containing nucleoside triphosphate hydrolase protein n=1 Tax=Lentinula aff. lateritia TaxID=2804960 RepID=A0ACC1UED8_9AGAR|nr:P-loop containing nucleoside triphosphate hydrolase protein [Lentinula aff. lateritia]